MSRPSKRRPGNVCIVGLGYVGLPLAKAVLEGGAEKIFGVDVSGRVVDDLMSGRSHVDDIGDLELGKMLASGFHATEDFQVVDDADVVVICVPTPLTVDGSPDLGAVTASASAIAGKLKQGALVVLESTTFPGTTEDILLPIFSRANGTVGRDFYLAYSPERVDPGNTQFSIRNTPKIVGGVTEACTVRAAEFYGTVADSIVLARGTREAETAKLLENTYRHINIALVNEMSKVCHELEIDIWDVIACASTKPFGFQAFYPGPGVGGHCIPIDPNYLSYAVKTSLGYPLRFVELAQEINSTMPSYVARRVQDLLNDDSIAIRGARVLLIGVTYKADIADQRESPANSVASHLDGMGADLTFHDPYVRSWTPNGKSVPKAADLSEGASAADLILILQHHSAVDLDPVIESRKPTLDTRGLLVGEKVEWL